MTDGNGTKTKFEQLSNRHETHAGHCAAQLPTLVILWSHVSLNALVQLFTAPADGSSKMYMPIHVLTALTRIHPPPTWPSRNYLLLGGSQGNQGWNSCPIRLVDTSQSHVFGANCQLIWIISQGPSVHSTPIPSWRSRHLVQSSAVGHQPTY